VNFWCLSIYLSPVTGAIPDAQKNGLVFPFRLLKRLRPPRIPINRVVGVLKEVRGFFVDQTVGSFHGQITPIFQFGWFILPHLKSEAQLASPFIIISIAFA
jgi:hypothetical protein